MLESLSWSATNHGSSCYERVLEREVGFNGQGNLAPGEWSGHAIPFGAGAGQPWETLVASLLLVREIRGRAPRSPSREDPSICSTQKM